MLAFDRGKRWARAMRPTPEMIALIGYSGAATNENLILNI
jgi:hypothetical protein